jgi:hypothetical protein
MSSHQLSKYFLSGQQLTIKFSVEVHISVEYLKFSMQKYGHLVPAQERVVVWTNLRRQVQVERRPEFVALLGAQLLTP